MFVFGWGVEGRGVCSTSENDILRTVVNNFLRSRRNVHICADLFHRGMNESALSSSNYNACKSGITSGGGWGK